MKIKIFIASFLFIGLLFTLQIKASAVYDPTSVPNNKIGIHLLFPGEISEVKDLVNSNNGDWGYVLVPIQAGDKDLVKWQSFMDQAKKLHLIPIIRLATEGDYFNKSTWRKPKEDDVIDFANFLNSLNWPTKNRYVIVFNEVNRADEWNGQANPEEYAKILSYSVTVFKSKSPDFFIIDSGMDNAAATGNGTFSQYDFFRAMDEAVPGIFSQIDGHSSHSYPNPAFTQSPEIDSPMSIHSFKYEADSLKELSGKDLPIFITETGWDQEKVKPETVAEYFKTALNTIWNNDQIIAITPFLLRAGPGPFEKFSFIKADGSKSESYKTFSAYPKTKGKPKLTASKKVLGDKNPEPTLVTKTFKVNNDEESEDRAKHFVRFILLGF